MKAYYAVDTTLYVLAENEAEVLGVLRELQAHVEQNDIHNSLYSVGAEPSGIRFLYVADEQEG